MSRFGQHCHVFTAVLGDNEGTFQNPALILARPIAVLLSHADIHREADEIVRVRILLGVTTPLLERAVVPQLEDHPEIRRSGGPQFGPVFREIEL